MPLSLVHRLWGATLATATALLVAGCPDATLADTCTDGRTFTDPAVVSYTEDGTAMTTIVIDWELGTEVGAELPGAYFAAGRLGDVDGGLGGSVSPSGVRELTVTLTGVQDYLATQSASSLHFSVDFPDRRDFVTCRHPGMDDVYSLEVDLRYTGDGTYLEATVTENLDLGDI